MAMYEPHTFIHPQLGPLTGRIPTSTPGVTQFRSVPFARIPARFRQSILHTSFRSDESRDFTQYGTACPAPFQSNDAIGGPVPGQGEIKYDEFSCLNLTVSAPTEALGDEGRKIPVMVYVHGGAFKAGNGHVSALHDTSRLVELSISEGHPVVIVSIHYRLNWFGFLACQDLLDEAKANSEPPSNFGLYDQRNSFLWIKRFISGFGGNPFRVTAFGESAGSGSIALQMCSDVPLFNRAMLQSATTATGPPVELKYKEAEYEALLQYCSIDLSDPKRLRKLREVPVSKVIEAIDGVFIPLFNSLRHESFFSRGFPTWWTEDELIGNCEWVDEVVIGDAFYEGWLLADALKHIPLDGFIQLSNTTLGIENAKRILSAYDITPKMDPNLFWTKLNFLIGDVAFSDPTHKLANSLATQKGPNRKKVYRYHLTIRNPFPGSSYHQIPGHHFVDMLFLFGTLKFRYPLQKQRDMSDEFGKRWLNFGNEFEPWEEYKIDGTEEEGKMMIIGGSEGWSLKSRERDERESKDSEEGERRYKGWEAIADVMRKLAEVGGGFVKENARLAWGPDGGIYRLLGVPGPYGIVRP